MSKEQKSKSRQTVAPNPAVRSRCTGYPAFNLDIYICLKG